ncbi:RNA polymerase Rpc34 [Pseudomassariella vexata]|uniref:DNA-directed RNA polymerase III subunit RPC6 n=1 Tax=Pseudomassariella vexata TaxID=1141098 RepID=A0A1Y2DEQ2_9PEZI|nr:RNA polymerase Rpc34 [Pseudomassariella vexata]ORY57763.1 RNA polymerase Rpc34 [Pseudomassariella vexata]
MDDQTSILKDQLYSACEQKLDPDGEGEKAYDRLFSQDDLFSLDVVPPKDLKTLMKLISMLTNDYLFIPVNTNNGPAWRLRPEIEAAKYSSLSVNQRMIYSLIDNAGADGVWNQQLRLRTNMEENLVKKVLKELEGKRLISSFTHVENAARKMWIKSSIKPSLKATGGAWFTDGDLDESLIGMISEVVYTLVKKHGAYFSDGSRSKARDGSISPVLPKKVIKGSTSDAALAARGKKRTADDMEVDGAPEVPVSPSKARKAKSGPVLLPMPAGYKGYITVPELTAQIARSNVTKGTKLKESDIKQLLDVLVYDGRIEYVKVGKREGYRASRISKQDPTFNVSLDTVDTDEPRHNGLTTAPCGRCPVFDLCEEGGPVWAGGCEYFDRWLI